MRTLRLIATLLALTICVVSLPGCSAVSGTPLPSPGARTAAPAPVRIGVLAAEDALPLWVAQTAGIFDKVGLTVDIVTFRSAAERDAAYKANQVDGVIADTVDVGKLWQAGNKCRIVSCALGTAPSQGRVGVLSTPKSRVRYISDLSTVTVSTSKDSMEEYVLDGLVRAKLQPYALNKRYINDERTRFQSLMRGESQAAVLSEPYLSLALHDRAHLVVQDTRGTNLSQTVLVFSDSYLSSDAGVAAVDRLLGAWDQAAILANAKRRLYRPLLAEKAQLPVVLRLHYRMNAYPHHLLPSRADLRRVWGWMENKGLLRDVPLYAEITWTAPW